MASPGMVARDAGQCMGSTLASSMRHQEIRGSRLIQMIERAAVGMVLAGTAVKAHIVDDAVIAAIASIVAIVAVVVIVVAFVAFVDDIGATDVAAARVGIAAAYAGMAD